MESYIPLILLNLKSYSIMEVHDKLGWQWVGPNTFFDAEWIKDRLEEENTKNFHP